ncbi:MAG TPA: NAD-dependent epimerase/dehydratase family protein [Chitinophagaceae bacterium]|nr:NAD-dependent epimerase/dehydratase family protein [Chitinophagaceae bacterium]
MTDLLNKKILVTGGVGFVGSNLVRKLIEKYNAEVTVLDDLFTGDVAFLKGLDYEFIHGTVEDAALVNECIQGKNIVFHLAARNIIVSNQNPREDLNVNVGGSFNVFEACLLHNVERVVYTSTSSVYGNPTKLPVCEDDNKSFLNFYSASKFSAETYAKTFFEVFNLPVTIIRYSNVYGINQSPANAYCGVIGKFIEAALSNKPISIHGDGSQTRDYTYIEDAIDATIAAAIFKKAIGNDYNIGTGIETSVNELVQHIIKISGSQSRIDHIENRDIDNIQRRGIDITKSTLDLQYTPSFVIEKGLGKTINWFASSLKKTSPTLLAVGSI